LPFQIPQVPQPCGPLALVVTLLIVPMSARPAPPAGTSLTTDAAHSIPRPLVASASGPYVITPERRALLNTIRYAEGTWKGDSIAGYQVLYGGGRFSDLSRHPEIVVRRTYASAAAGAYQFLPDTWKGAARRLRLRDFRPASQDQAALHLVEQRGALKSFDHQGLSAEVLARLAPEWASLPTLQGQSHYGQPVKTREELRRFYAREVERQRRLGRA
jgi:muramidase (phage lysozyme)